MQVIRKDGTHSLEGFKAFTKNHTDGTHTFTLASEGKPCDDRGTQMIVEISNEEVDMFISFIEKNMFKDIEVVAPAKDEITKEEKAFCLDLAKNIKFYDLQKQFKKLLKKKKKKCSKIEGKASFGEIVSLLRILDRNFNHAFTAGMGAGFNDDGKLMSVDGMALLKYGYFETHPYIKHSNGNGYLLKYEGSLFEDTYKISVLRVDRNKTVDDIASRVRNLEDKEPMHEIKGEVE